MFLVVGIGMTLRQLRRPCLFQIVGETSVFLIASLSADLQQSCVRASDDVFGAAGLPRGPVFGAEWAARSSDDLWCDGLAGTGCVQASMSWRGLAHDVFGIGFAVYEYWTKE